MMPKLAKLDPDLPPKRRAVAKMAPIPPVDPAATLTLSLAMIVDIVAKMLPAGSSSQEAAAVDYWGASVAHQYAEAWRGRAKKLAAAAGVLPDQLYPIGTAETVYAGTLVTIGLKVAAQADRVDVPGLVADLERAGIAPKVLKRLVAKHTRSFPGAHTFTATVTATA